MKWRCALIQRKLPDYPDGELSSFWKRLVAAHLKACPECRLELEELAEVVRLYQAEPLPDPGPEFWQEFDRELHLKLARVNQSPEERAPRSRRLPHYLAGATALAGILALAVYLGPFTNPAPGPKLAEPQEEAQVPRQPLARRSPQALQAPAAAPEPPPSIAKTLPPEPKSAENVKTLADRLARPEPTRAEEAGYSLVADKLDAAPTPTVFGEAGLWPEDDFLSWDVDSAIADLSREERADLKRRLELRR